MRFNLILLCALIVAGCEGVWNIANRSAASEDLQKVFAKSGVKIPDLSCTMIGTSRSFKCTATSKSSDIETLSKFFDLSDEDSKTYHTKGACTTIASIEGAVVRRSVTARSPKISGFEYLIVAFNPKTGEGCFESSYSYG